jgi:hypothetical protein
MWSMLSDRSSAARMPISTSTAQPINNLAGMRKTARRHRCYWKIIGRRAECSA